MLEKCGILSRGTEYLLGNPCLKELKSTNHIKPINVGSGQKRGCGRMENFYLKGNVIAAFKLSLIHI